MIAKIVTAFLCAIISAAAAGLTIEHAALHQSEDGQDLASTYTFRPAETVYFNFQVSGYQRKEEGDDTRVRLSWQILVKDDHGVDLVEPSHGKIDALITAEDKSWLPIGRHSFPLPSYIPSGQYKLLLDVKDENAGASAQSEIPFRVANRDVPPNDTLTIRNFRFLRAEEELEPLKLAAYRPGDTLWVRFDITGYKLEQGNHFSVSYGIRVFRRDGTVAYEQADAANTENSSYYPRRYVPGVFSLNMPPDLPRGQYTLAVDVVDKIGGQKYTATGTFSVE